MISQLNSELYYQEYKWQSFFFSLLQECYFFTFFLADNIPNRYCPFYCKKPAAGITMVNVITKIACKDTNVTLLPSLNNGKYFFCQPMVQLDEITGIGWIRQILRDGMFTSWGTFLSHVL